MNSMPVLGEIDRIQTHRLFPRAAFQALFPTGAFDEDSTHRLSGRAEEVGAILPITARITHQPEIGLMNQRGWLERVSRSFLSHASASEPTQFLVNQR